jgi:hypothetical protein
MSATTPIAGTGPSVFDRLYDLMDRVDYRLVTSDEDRDAVFRLRYDAYVREQTIAPNFSKRLSDAYDDLENTWIYALFVDGKLASTIRLGIATQETPAIATRDSFPDYLEPEIAAGRVIIDPTRHATDPEMGHRYPGLIAYLTVRIPWMAGEFLGADQILACVRPEHEAFFKRVFGHVRVREPRPYKQLTKQFGLMTLNFPAARERVHRRYPFFRSTAFERRALFDVAGTVKPDWSRQPAAPEYAPAEPAAAG